MNGIDEAARNSPQSAADAEMSGRSIGQHHMSLRDIITDAIRRNILTGHLKPGSRLVEDRLAEEFGVSRNPVREALRSLETEGLVEVVPRRGALVASLSDDEMQEIGELRAALEGLSARLAARRVTEEMRRRIAEIVDRGDRAAAAGDADQLNQLNNEFHVFLAEAGRNRFLADFMRALRDRTHWMYLSSMSWRRGEAWREHASILRAIADGDEELAAVLANRHVTNAAAAYAEQSAEDRRNAQARGVAASAEDLYAESAIDI